MIPGHMEAIRQPHSPFKWIYRQLRLFYEVLCYIYVQVVTMEGGFY